MEECIFCKIVEGEIPAQKVYEDDVSFAFLDNSPVNIGHTLLIPKAHHENIYELPDELLEKLAVNVKKIAGAVKEGMTSDGINIGMNNGEAAGQVIFHAHIHIIPRFKNDGHEHWESAGSYREDEAKETADKIIEKLS